MVAEYSSDARPEALKLLSASEWRDSQGQLKAPQMHSINKAITMGAGDADSEYLSRDMLELLSQAHVSRVDPSLRKVSEDVSRATAAQMLVGRRAGTPLAQKSPLRVPLARGGGRRCGAACTCASPSRSAARRMARTPLVDGRVTASWRCATRPCPRSARRRPATRACSSRRVARSRTRDGRGRLSARRGLRRDAPSRAAQAQGGAALLRRGPRPSARRACTSCLRAVQVRRVGDVAAALLRGVVSRGGGGCRRSGRRRRCGR